MTRVGVPLLVGGALAVVPLGAAHAAPAKPDKPGTGCPASSGTSAPTILDPQATLDESGEPVMSVLVANPTGVGDVAGKITVTRPNGDPIDAHATATGTVPSGNRLTYVIPDDTLTRNAPFRWTVTATNTATGGSSCYASGPGRHPFTPIRVDPHSGAKGRHLTRMPIRVGAGDGALVVGWGRPMLWPGGGGNADDHAGFTPGGKYAYTVTAVAPDGEVAASADTTTTRATLGGLANGTRYQVHIQAHYTDDTGTTTADMADSYAVGKPVAVPGGGSAYTDAVGDLLDAEHGLQNGTYPTATAALAGTGASKRSAGGPSITSWLTAHTAHDQEIGAFMKASDQRLTDDMTTLSNAVTTVSPDGTTVTVHANAKRTFTTVDGSTATEKKVAGSEDVPVGYVFTVRDGHAELTGYASNDALTLPVTGDAFPTMTATDLPRRPGAPGQVATDPATGMFVKGPARVTPYDHHGNLEGIAEWAEANAFGDYNGFGNDCTDFASRAMNQGGGMPMNIPFFPWPQRRDDDYWFQGQYVWGLHVSSYSWGGAWQLSDYLYGQGSHFVSYTDEAKRGDIIWANWTGSDWNGISHTGVVTENDGTNLYITQHSNSRINEPLYLTDATDQTWSNGHPDLHVWVAEPYEKN